MLVTSRRSYVFKLVPPYGTNYIHVVVLHPGMRVSNRKYQAPKRRGDPQPALNNHGLPLVVNVTSLQIPIIVPVARCASTSICTIQCSYMEICTGLVTLCRMTDSKSSIAFKLSQSE